MRKIICIMSLILVFGLAPASASDDRTAITAVMDGFHDAAAQADEKRYLGYFTADGVFMGTDDWERWPLKPDFTNYVHERFKGGTGWTYQPQERHIAFAPGHKVAWIDEIMRSEKWGLFRGTGVLIKGEKGWKLAHYSLTALVANEAFADVAALNKAAIETRKAAKE